jgi:type I restriction enzyme S subunit
MTSNWQTKKLSEICNVFNGLWKGKKTPYTEVGVIRNTNFTKEGFLDYSNVAYLPVEVKQYEKRKLKFGDIILEKSGGGPKQPVGRVAFFDKKGGEYSFSNFTSAIRILNRNILDSNFLHRFLYFEYISGKTELMQRRSTGIRNLQLKEYKQIQVPLPRLSEQKRIVEILDKVFDKIARAKENVENNLQNARELFESHVGNIFLNPKKDWEETCLGTACKYFNGKAHERCIDENGQYIVVNSKFISTEGAITKRTNNAQFILLTGDIVMVLSDVPNGKALAKCFFIDQDETYTLNQRICVIRSNNFDKRFLYYQLNRNRHFLSFNNGENQTNLRLNQVLDCPLYIPPMVEQKAIAKNIDLLKEECQRLETIYQQKLNNLEELKKSVLQRVFMREL